MAKQTTIGDFVPFPHQVGGDQDRFPAIGFEAQGRLQSQTPARIKAQPGFIKQKHRGVRQEKQSQA
jgi:hypothetical protein